MLEYGGKEDFSDPEKMEEIARKCHLLLKKDKLPLVIRKKVADTLGKLLNAVGNGEH